MSYSNETKYFKLPTPKYGDTFSVEGESRKANIIDTQLFGAIYAHSNGYGILKEGTWSVNFVDNNSSIYLSSPDLSNLPSIVAFIDQTLVHTLNTLSWTGLSNNKEYYLYVQLVETETLSSKQYGHLVTSYNETGITPSSALLIARVTTTDSEIILDISPVGKIRIYTVDDHASLSKDPHGQVLEQTYMQISGLDVLRKLETNTLIVYNQFDTTNLNVTGNTTFEDGITVYDEFVCSGISIFSGIATFKDNIVCDKIITSGLELIQEQEFKHSIICSSGISVDGVDISELRFLIDGSNADWNGKQGHVHDGISGLGVNWITFNPVYQNTVVYEKEYGILEAIYDSNKTYYKWSSTYPISSGTQLITLVTRMVVPSDFKNTDANEVMKFGGKVDNYEGSGITLRLFDTENNEVFLVGMSNIENLDYTQKSCPLSGLDVYVFDKMNSFTVMTTLTSVSGMSCWLSDLSFKYTR